MERVSRNNMQRVAFHFFAFRRFIQELVTHFELEFCDFLSAHRVKSSAGHLNEKINSKGKNILTSIFRKI
jgi:hypothetical protein